MWRSASESKPVHSRYSRLSQAWRTAKPIRIISAVSNWFRCHTSHELNSLNSIRLMWSMASEPGLRQAKHDSYGSCHLYICHLFFGLLAFLSLHSCLWRVSTGKNNWFPILDIFGYLKNTHKNPKFGRVRQIPIWELGWEFPDWDLSHFFKFGIFVGIL